MPPNIPRSPLLTSGMAAIAVALSLTVCSPVVADGQVYTPGLPSDSSTEVSPVSARSEFLNAPGAIPLAGPFGFGAATTGGAGGRLLHVTTAQDVPARPAEGSLRWAVSQPGPKWIVFDSDLAISLSAPLRLTSDTTIDGRGRQVVITGPGVTGIEIHDIANVVLESVTLRGFGDPSRTWANDPDDAVSIERSSRVWIDHCSLARAGDKLIGAVDGVRELTLSWNHFSEQQQTVQVGSMSTAINDLDSTVTIAYNHFDHVGYRTPVVSYGKAHVYNNYMDTWSVSGVRSERLAQTYLEGNVFAAGTAPKATMVTPAQNCNDRGTLCDSRSGYLLDTGNLFIGRNLVNSTGTTHMFDPAAAYSYDVLPATADLAMQIASGAGVGAASRADAAPSVTASPSPIARVVTRIRARSTKSDKDRLRISTSGVGAAGLAASVYRRAGSSGWELAKTVRLDQRGRAQLRFADRDPRGLTRYVVDVMAGDAHVVSRSRVIAVR